MIGDVDPEDAYDAGDPPLVRLNVLERVVSALEDPAVDARRAARVFDALRVVDILARARDVDAARVISLRARLEALT